MAKPKGVKDRPHQTRSDVGRTRLGEYIGPGSDGRTCEDCSTWKPATEFWRVTKSGNLFAYCKSCGQARNRRRYTERYSSEEYRALNTVRQRAARRALKDEVIAAYGGGCGCCGEDTYEFLTLDHVNNDGAEHRRETGVGTGIGMWRLAKRQGFPDTFQILCWNCNSAKGAFGMCPHSITIRKP